MTLILTLIWGSFSIGAWKTMKTTQEIINQNQEQIERINHLLEPSSDPFIKFMESLIKLPPIPKPDLGRWLAVNQSVERL